MIQSINEKNTNHKIQDELDSLCKMTYSDFSALAWMDQYDNRIRWLYVSGNSNDRFNRLAVKSGRGLAGLVLKLGRPVIIDASMTNEELSRVHYDYPIMHVEHLHSALAVPVKVFEQLRSVLLIGNRSSRYYNEDDLVFILNSVERFAKLLQ